MRYKPNPTIALFHRDELNRKGVIKSFNSEFEIKEIELWENIQNCDADILIILAPELLFPAISFESMTDRIKQLNAKVIVGNYDNRMWWFFRGGITQLKNPSEEMLRRAIRKLLPVKKSRISFLKNVKKEMVEMKQRLY